MRRTSAACMVCVCVLGLCASWSASARQQDDEDEQQEDGTRTDDTGAEFLKCNKAAWRVPGQYLVVLREGSRDSHVQRTASRLRAAAARTASRLEILRTFSGALHGVLVQMSRDVLHLALQLPRVRYVEEDAAIFAQSLWNLQRILQPHGGANETRTYTPPNAAMAAVYLMDGGVQTSHREIEGRVLITEFSNVPEEGGVRVHRQAAQCDAHGTHTAGVVSGSDSGVARGAAVNLVRVLNCQGRGTVSGALAGLQYIRATRLSRPASPAVVLLPFVGAFSRLLNAACRDAAAGGAVVVAAAGNYRDDACLYSPASEPEVITVGAVNSADRLMSQGAGGTNFGRCVDLFAPGDDIVSASSACSTCFTSRSGTSQAAAHVAGVAAVILSSNQNTAPAEVLQTMLRYSISNTIDFLSLSAAQRLVTPNMVAAMAPADSTKEELLCRSVWSERSEVAGANMAVSRCRRGEEMMSCSGYTLGGGAAGETVTVTGGRMECVAHSAAGGGGVFAVARCCVTAGPRCRVHAAGPDAERGATPQPPGFASRPAGSMPSRAAAASRGVRCRAASLECNLLENRSADEDEVEVSCPPGWTLTGCSSVPQGAAIMAPAAGGDACRVRGGGGGTGAAGAAVCCRVRPSTPVSNVDVSSLAN
ncbi:proprotein convertase subtilisin/kexin type 9 isoform X1 [Clinocottus analis]|uniref:proprotein convertase subtilisin/kexin type 9 isoform X1 n=1 Tax=Clinocottus analis TaxID=304258 RepID=UPI0035C24FE2